MPTILLVSFLLSVDPAAVWLGLQAAHALGINLFNIQALLTRVLGRFGLIRRGRLQDIGKFVFRQRSIAVLFIGSYA